MDFLRGFERSIKSEVAGILELLPISSATEREWQERRSSVPESAIARVECYVEAYIADNQRGYTQKWTYYNEALGEKAAAYLWLVHPNYVPESMRGAYVKPDAANVGDTDEFISLEEAIKQLLRYIVAESPRKRDLHIVSEDKTEFILSAICDYSFLAYFYYVDFICFVKLYQILRREPHNHAAFDTKAA